MSRCVQNPGLSAPCVVCGGYDDEATHIPDAGGFHCGRCCPSCKAAGASAQARAAARRAAPMTLQQGYVADAVAASRAQRDAAANVEAIQVGFPGDLAAALEALRTAEVWQRNAEARLRRAHEHELQGNCPWA